jgi:hypothetical protein
MDYVLLCLWALCLSLAWIGTGWQIMRVLGFTEISWSLSGVVGLSAFIFVGGFLNLAGLVHRPSLIVLVVLGDILFAVTLASSKSRLSESWASFVQQPLYVRSLALVCAAMLIIFASVSLIFSWVNVFDDLPAYLSFPVKLIQLGSLPFDPFSERRVQSGLGANFFLQSFMLVVGDVRSMCFIDAGAGLILFAGCIYQAGRRLGNTAAVCLSLVVLILLVPLSHLNLTMATLPAAIFTALFLIETADEAPAVSKSALLALLGAAVAMLKSTYLPLALLILLTWHLLRLREGPWKRAVREALIGGVLFLVALLPWMLDLKRKEGTMLYPLLGKGYEIAAYGPVPHFFSAGLYPVEAGLAVLIVCAVAAAMNWMAARGLRHASKVSLMALSGGLVVLPISIAVAGSELSRYTRPFLLPLALILLASLARISLMGGSERARRLILGTCAATLVLGLVTYGKRDRSLIFYKYIFRHRQAEAALDSSYFKLSDDVLARENKRQWRLQNTIPPGQAVYASFLPTFAMNFQRNSIYIADFPGMTSLPPGMPTQGAPTALRSYLLSKSVRYVAYSRKLTAEMDEVLHEPPPKPGHTWSYMEALNSTDVDRQILSLSETCRVIYDDGDERVIDLSQSH